MEPIICSNCSAIQPKDWKAGSLCNHCGKAVRPEVRCAWCCKWSPLNKFCRECGTELIPQEHFGSARMLKNSGVDQFMLAERVRALDKDQLENFERIYQKHLSLLLQLVKEVEDCEKYLVQKNHHQNLFEEFITLLPFTDEQFKKYIPVPTGNLTDILKSSTVPSTKTLAALALLRSGSFEVNETERHELLITAQSALKNTNTSIALEAAFTLANWRMKLSPFIEWLNDSDFEIIGRLGATVLDNSELQSWGAVCYWPWMQQQNNLRPSGATPNLQDKIEENKIHEYFVSGLHSNDTDLAFCCAFSLQDENDLAAFLDDENSDKQYLAARILAKNKSLHLSKFLQNSINQDELLSILYILKPPLPKPLQETLLLIIEKQTYPIMQRIFQLLENDWDENVERSLIQKASQNKNYDLFNLLIRSKKIPNHDQTITAFLELPFTEKTVKSFEYIKMQYRFPDFFIDKIGTNHDQKLDDILLGIAQEQIIKFQHQVFLRWIMESIFCDERDQIKREAIWVLIRCQRQSANFKPFIFNAENIQFFFKVDFFLEKLTLLLHNDFLLKEVGVYDWLTEFLGSFDLNFSELRVPDHIVKNFLNALFNIITNDYWLFLRTSATKCLGHAAQQTSHQQEYGIQLQSFLSSHELLFDLSETIRITIEKLQQQKN